MTRTLRAILVGHAPPTTSRPYIVRLDDRLHLGRAVATIDAGAPAAGPAWLVVWRLDPDHRDFMTLPEEGPIVAVETAREAFQVHEMHAAFYVVHGWAPNHRLA
jgi:hypothetical protein